MPLTRGFQREGVVVAAGILLLAVAWAGSAVTLRSIDRGKPAGWDQASLLYLPSGKFLKPIAMDLDEGLAAVLWVKGVLYFSETYLKNEESQWLGHILDVVTTLNPRFLYVYEFGGTVLLGKKSQWPKTRILLERGIAQFPQNWKLRVYAAMGFKKNDSNFVLAAEVLKPVTLQPDVPNHIRTLSATMLESGGDSSLAFAFLVNRYLQSPDAILRDIFVERILKYASDSIAYSDRKKMVEKVLGLAEADPRSEGLVVTILREYLMGKMSPGSIRVIQNLNR